MLELLPGNELLMSIAFWLMVGGLALVGVLVLLALVGEVLGFGEAVECPLCGSKDPQVMPYGCGERYFICNDCGEIFYPKVKKEPEETKLVDGGGRFP